ncbi:phosphoribosyltransferase [Candidatus Woesearchaeota archaeon]|nr:phosphoribosyltransferase [Candidatus Woesearchaeota archaeon]
MFQDRFDAGKQLAARLSKYKGSKDVIVVGIPRGGVEVAYAVAKELKVKLSIAVSKKLPFPGNPELAIGAVAFGGVMSLDDSFALQHGVGKDYVEAEKKKLAAEIKRRYLAYGINFPSVKGKTAVVVDDGMATGHTVLAAVRAVRKGKPRRIVVAVPVSSQSAVELLRSECDEVICLDMPEWFMAVGEFYRSFPQLTDEDIINYLKLAKAAAK